MLPKEENELITKTNAGTTMGEVLRRYWIPALLSEEIPAPDCPPARVRLLGEELVAFRDTQGRIGLIGEHCSHRGTSLFFGRNEASSMAISSKHRRSPAIVTSKTNCATPLMRLMKQTA
ncbi:MAG: Rieske 2Fe-2S domain-containing protein [Candidatus Binatia bacterium]